MFGLIIFLCIFTGILIAGHWFLFFSMMHFFRITDRRTKYYLRLILAIGSVSFIPSMLLARAYENALTGAIYTIAGLWLAINWHILMMCILLWCIIGVAKFLKKPLIHHRTSIAIFFILCALGWSAYGIWCAFYPRIVYVNIHIDDLPMQWHDKTLVHLSDLHAGHVYGVYFLNRIIRQINDIAPHMVVITGDYFDGMDNHLQYLTEPLAALTASDGIYVVTGNHETYIDTDRTIQSLRTQPVTVLDDTMIIVDDMQIIGISYPERGVVMNIAATLTSLDNYDPHKPTILLYHSPDHVVAAKNAGVDLQLSGHTHHGQLFPFQLITRILYGPYHHGKSNEDHFTIYTSGGVGTWGPPMRTSGRPEIVVINFD